MNSHQNVALSHVLEKTMPTIPACLELRHCVAEKTRAACAVICNHHSEAPFKKNALKGQLTLMELA
jgi:hypothetical protein